MKTYKKPVLTVDAGMAEGVYAASGASQGTLNVVYIMVWDDWSSGGKGLLQADWSGIDGMITLNMNFNDTIDQVEANGASGSCSGKNVTLTFASTVENPLTIGVHINHGTSIKNLQMTGYTYSVN